jgi:hypothetical protein
LLAPRIPTSAASRPREKGNEESAFAFFQI